MIQGSFLQLLYPVEWPAVAAIQLPNHVQLFVTPWTAAYHTSLSFTISWSLFKLMSAESMMPSNHLILCGPLFLLPLIFPSIRVFSNESALWIRWPKYCPLSCFADTETLTRWKKLTVCCSQAHIPQTSWNQKVMMLTSSDLTTNQLEDCPHVDHTLLLECYDSLLPLPGRVGHTILRAVSCCGLFCLAKQES